MQWNQENVVKFINAYQTKKILWDPSHKQYYNKILKNDAWIDISLEMGCSVKDLKKKMDNLLAQLRREKARIRKTIGQGPDDVYMPSWYAYEHFKFLLRRNKTRHHMEDPTQNEQTTTHTNPQNIKSADKNSSRASKQTTKIRKSNNSVRRMITATEDVATRLPVEALDDIQIYTNFIASKFRSYSQRTKNALQHQISNLLYQADSGCFECYQHGVSSQESLAFQSPEQTENDLQTSPQSTSPSVLDDSGEEDNKTDLVTLHFI